MTKENILEYFNDINEAYNNPNKHDDLSKMLDMLVQQEPCGKDINVSGMDAVSREAVEDAIIWNDEKKEMLDEIQKLPSVQAKQKTGTWRKDIDNSRRWDRVRFYCSECGSWQTYGETDFCPSCGARMIKPQESEGKE